MTERLKQLLDDEAGGLSVPSPAPHDVIRQGRGIRRRNRLVVVACGAAAAVIVGGSVVALAGGGTNQAAPDPAAPTLSDNAAFSYGNQVFYDGPDHQAEIQDNAVKSLYYTSAGVLVRHGENAWSDGGGPQRFSLVTPDGVVKRLTLETEETVHATDLDQPYVTYAEAVDGELQVVVYDVTTDTEAARVTVGPTSESWFPVSIDGDTVYVQDGYENGTFAVDWKAGTATESSLDSTWSVAGGRVATEIDHQPAIVDIESGDVLLTVDREGYFNLSPDGRYAELFNDEGEASGEDAEFEVFDVETGSSVTFAGPAYDWGWTTAGDRFHVDKTEVRTCDSETGKCTTQPYAQPNLPKPAPVTETFSSPVCPAGAGDCYLDNEFLQNCYDHRDQCEWDEQVSVTETTNELKLGGRIYES
jgi:hypothetical protein